MVEAPVQSKPAPDKTNSEPKAPSQKKPLSKAVVIGIIILVVIILAAVMGLWLAGGNNPSDESTPASYSTNEVQVIASYGDTFISVLQNTIPNKSDFESPIPWNGATIV